MSEKRLFETAGVLTNDNVPGQVRALVESLAALHGDVTLAKEARGIHICLACPGCLEREGDRELPYYASQHSHGPDGPR